MTQQNRRRLAWVVAVVLLLISLVPKAYLHLVAMPAAEWQVDLDVYRSAGQSLLQGREVYEYLTPAPQHLPFTYPPFPALLAVPLALVPFTLLGWIWWWTQAAAIAGIVWIAGRSFWTRPQWWWPAVFGLVTTIAYQVPAVHDGLRFGQVNAFLILAILADLTRAGWVRRIPTGTLVGLATAIKLTPGIFLVYLAVTRQWKALGNALTAAAGVTLVAAIIAPGTSFAFWFDALFAPDRLGANGGPSNQSWRGLLLHFNLEGTVWSVVWLVLVALTVVGGMLVAKRRFDADPDDQRAAIAVVGFVGVLVSPVSWIHHHTWVLVLLPALAVLAGRSRLRWTLTGLLAGAYLVKLPWWGYWALGSPTRHGLPWPTDPGWQILVNGYVGTAVLAIVAVALGPGSERAAAHAPDERVTGCRPDAAV